MKESIQISIITVGMNHLNFLKTLLQSLYKDNRPKLSFEMIYVDNCSSDDSICFIEKNYPDVIIIKNKEILGFGENNNKGARNAKGKYIAIINPDIIFLDGTLDLLWDKAEKLNYNCILAPKLLNLDKSFQYSVRGFLTPWVFMMRFLTIGNDQSKSKIVENYLCKNINQNETQLIDWALGAALFMNTTLFRKLQGFDESYFLYIEDVDLCLRSWKINVPVIYYPDSKCIHNHLRSSSMINKRTLFHLKSYFVYFWKHGLFVKSYKGKFKENF